MRFRCQNTEHIELDECNRKNGVAIKGILNAKLQIVCTHVLVDSTETQIGSVAVRPI